MTATEPCPQLLLRPLPQLETALQRIDPRLFFKAVVWRDAKSREELSPYRKGEQILTCGVLEARAKLFLAGARTGVIEPQIQLRSKLLALIYVLSTLLLAPAVYLVHLPFTFRKDASGGQHG